MRVFLAGASGAIGRPLTRSLVARGHEVVGIVRSANSSRALHEIGASTVVADVLDREALLRAVRGAEADSMISQLTALKKPPLRHSDMRATNRLRVDGTANLIEAAREVGARRFLTQSMVFGYGYGDLGSRPLHEEAPFGQPTGNAFDEHLEAMAVNERLVLDASGIEGIALRYGLFYGGDIENIAALLRRRMLPVVQGGGRLPFVHHDDAAAATVSALENGHGGLAYNVTDDEPVAFGAVVDEIAAATGSPRPWRVPGWLVRATLPYGGMMMTGARMSVSTESVRALGWAPIFPTYREGVAASAKAITGLIPE